MNGNDGTILWLATNERTDFGIWRLQIRHLFLDCTTNTNRVVTQGDITNDPSITPTIPPCDAVIAIPSIIVVTVVFVVVTLIATSSPSPDNVLDKDDNDDQQNNNVGRIYRNIYSVNNGAKKKDMDNHSPFVKLCCS